MGGIDIKAINSFHEFAQHHGHYGPDSLRFPVSQYKEHGLLNTLCTMDQMAYGSQLADARNIGATEAQSWHEVSAIPMKDLVTLDVILLHKTDITARTEPLTHPLAHPLAGATEAQRWRKVSSIPMKDPVTLDVILLHNTDITARTEPLTHPLAHQLAGATEAQSWHEVSAIPMKDPVTGTDVILLLQTDITARTELEMRMAALTEVQLTMLEQMFPRHVLEFMLGPGSHATDQQGHLATSHSDVTILFMDIVGFTSMSKEVQPEKVMQYLNNLFTLFDVLVDNYKVYKVETAGDCYIVAGGLMRYDEEGFLAVDKAPDARTGALQAMEFAKAMLRCAKTVLMPHNNEPTKVRVGMHTGPVVTGLIGMKLPKFSVFGDTMNTASRMESTCRMGAIQVSELTGKLLGDTHTFEPTGGVEVKGKGMMNTFIWSPDKNPSENYSSLTKIEQTISTMHSRNEDNTKFRNQQADLASRPRAGPYGTV
eukprot:gene7328-449_t